MAECQFRDFTVPAGQAVASTADFPLYLTVAGRMCREVTSGSSMEGQTVAGPRGAPDFLNLA
ncbi:hypothetical protein RM96_30730 [Cupriavidus sp. IDO]|nr:hypothetical protein RM96_30730 [Cupriavidus sp. IDO]